MAQNNKDDQPTEAKEIQASTPSSGAIIGGPSASPSNPPQELPQPAPQQKSPAAEPQASKDATEAQMNWLRENWEKISRVDRVWQVKQLIDKRISRRKLGEKIGVSDKTIGKLADPASLTPDEQKALDSGKVSIKKTLKGVQRKKALAKVKILTGKKAWEEEVQYWAEVIKEWISEEIPIDEKAIAELPRKWNQIEAKYPALEFRIEALEKIQMQPIFEYKHLKKPIPTGPVLERPQDPKRFIRRWKPASEPERGKGDSRVALINYWIEWFAAWGTRLIPSWSLRDDALARAIRVFKNEEQGKS